MQNQYVYLLKVQGKSIYKIGSSHTPVNRLNSIKTNCPYKLLMVHCVECLSMKILEDSLHKKFRMQRLQREWFELTTPQVKHVIEIMNTAILDVAWGLEETEDFIVSEPRTKRNILNISDSDSSKLLAMIVEWMDKNKKRLPIPHYYFGHSATSEIKKICQSIAKEDLASLFRLWGQENKLIISQKARGGIYVDLP